MMGLFFIPHSMSIQFDSINEFLKLIGHIKDGKSINYTIDDIKEIIHNFYS